MAQVVRCQPFAMEKRFNLRPLHVGFVVDKLSVGHSFLSVSFLQYSLHIFHSSTIDAIYNISGWQCHLIKHFSLSLSLPHFTTLCSHHEGCMKFLRYADWNYSVHLRTLMLGEYLVLLFVQGSSEDSRCVHYRSCGAHVAYDTTAFPSGATGIWRWPWRFVTAGSRFWCPKSIHRLFAVPAYNTEDHPVQWWQATKGTAR